MCKKLLDKLLGRPTTIETGKTTDFEVFEISLIELKRNFEELGLEFMLKAKFIPDYTVRYTSEHSWDEMVPFLTFPADKYVEEGCDCDDYAKRASAEASFEFGLNGCFQCWGDMPLGSHAWNLVVTGPKSFKLFEPNAGFGCAGELFVTGDSGYQPKSWK